MAFATADDVLSRVRAEAVAEGWRGIEAGAELGLAMVALHTGTRPTTSRLRDVGARALATFEDLGDDRGMAAALVFLARERLLGLRFAEAEELLVRALPPAERSGDAQLAATIVVGLARAAVFGPRPADDGVSLCEELLARARAIGPTTAASISMLVAVLEALLGNTARARALSEEGKAVMEELAPGAALSFGHYAGFASLIAGDLSMPNVNFAPSERCSRSAASAASHRRSQPFGHTHS